MVVDELRNSFSRVAIAGYYGSARVALFGPALGSELDKRYFSVS